MRDTMTVTTNIGTPLIDAINSKDARASLTEIQQYKNMMRDSSVGSEYVLWITEPVNLTNVHKTLADNLQVPPRLLAIRRSSMNRTQKAVLLTQAIETAIKRVHNL